jgi:hypothetical protein
MAMLPWGHEISPRSTRAAVANAIIATIGAFSGRKMMEYFGFQSFFAPVGRPALVLTLSTTMAFAASDTLKFRKGTPYAIARATLLARGWSPVKASTSGCEPGREDICAAYPETQSCAGTGFGICTFEFKSRSGSSIEIVTHGGSVQKLTVSEVIDCPKTGCD